MTDISTEELRIMCDQFQTARVSINVTWVTRFDDFYTGFVSDLAKLALDSFNQTEQTNFKLEKVCKLNRINIYFCMTFRARNAETDECRLFRGVVALDDVMLCEIMVQRRNETSSIWYLDSGCYRHMTGNKELLQSTRPKEKGSVTFGDNRKGTVEGIGSIGCSIVHQGAISSNWIHYLVEYQNQSRWSNSVESTQVNQIPKSVEKVFLNR